jgi:hypothetical protein
MDIKKHGDEFKRIVAKYSLEEKADEIAEFLTKNHGAKVAPKEFASLFMMEEEDAVILLTFIERGISFRQM